MFVIGEQERYVLMRKDVPVCAFSYSLRRRSVQGLETFSPADAPWGAWVPYEVERRDGRAVSVCPCFADAATEFVPLDDVLRHFDPLPTEPRTSLHGLYVGLFEQLAVPDARDLVDCTVVLDFLTANDDRHEFNLGVMLDSDTRRPLRVDALERAAQGR